MWYYFVIIIIVIVVIIIIGDAHSRVRGRADGGGRVYPPAPCDDDGEP